MNKAKTYTQLEKAYTKEIVRIQKECPHPKHRVKRFDQCWAPGHYTGNVVVVCTRCNKTLETIRPKEKQEVHDKLKELIKNGSKKRL